jgi:hypothetical protein
MAKKLIPSPDEHVAILSALKQHGSLRTTAAALSLSYSAMHLRASAARNWATSQIVGTAAITEESTVAPEPAKQIAPVNSATATQPSTDIHAILGSLIESQRQQGEMLARLVTGQHPAATPPATPLHVPASPAVEPAKAQTTEPVMGILGDDSPYEGEIWGITTKRRPRIGRPASSVPRTTVIIGDSHFHPAILDKTRRCMTLVGLHVARTSPHDVVHIGDGPDMSSVCNHVRNDTWKAREKPSIRQDLDCFRDNMRTLSRAFGAWDGKRHYCKGNHDAWLWTYEDNHPEIKGIATGEFDDILTAEEWTHTDYGEYYWLGGVGYVHVPLNLMGRPVGGQTAENTISMQSTRDTVFGHTHRKGVAQRIKFDGEIVTTLNAGSSMPEFYVGEYAQLTQGRRIDYGCLEVTDYDGRIQSYRHIPMRELEHLYGAAADRMLRS